MHQPGTCSIYVQPKQHLVLRAGILYNESPSLLAICFNTTVCTRCHRCRRTKPQRSSVEASFSMHYSQPGTKEIRMGRKRTTLWTDSSAAVCTGCQTKSLDVFNRRRRDIFNSIRQSESKLGTLIYQANTMRGKSVLLHWIGNLWIGVLSS